MARPALEIKHVNYPLSPRAGNMEGPCASPDFLLAGYQSQLISIVSAAGSVVCRDF